MQGSQNRSPDVLTSLLRILEAVLGDLHIGLPATVESYDPATQLATVQPTLIRVFLNDDDSENPQPYPLITDVPVQFPQGGGGYLTFPLQPGDPVWLSFGQRSLDAWKETDGQTQIDPGDTRRHHLTDAVAYPGVRTARNPLANVDGANVVLGASGSGVKVKVGSKDAAHGVGLGDGIAARLGAIESWIASAVTTAAAAAGNLPNVPLPNFTADTSAVASAKVLTDG